MDKFWLDRLLDRSPSPNTNRILKFKKFPDQDPDSEILEQERSVKRVTPAWKISWLLQKQTYWGV